MARFTLSPSRVARYFYHDCERHLRYHATPSRHRAAEGVPPRPYDQSPVTAAILEGGYRWEEEVIQTHLEGRVRIAPGDSPLRERAFTLERTLEQLITLTPDEAVYQPTLVAPPVFLERYGLDPELVELPACRPDLIQLVRMEDGSSRLRVIDVKASDILKTSHRIQAALYTLILRDLLQASGYGLEVDLHTAGIWLFQEPKAEWFDLSLTTSVLETFLRDDLPGILTAPANEVAWHLFFRCEWCEYYAHCRQEAEATRSVSLLPYLSVGGRRYLRQAGWPDGQRIDTLDELRTLLESDRAATALAACGSLRGRKDRLKRAIDALDRGEVIPHGGSSVALPIREDVLLMITLQRDPQSGSTYAAGFRRLKGAEVFGSGSREEIFVAATPEECDQIGRRFLQALHAELRTLHAYNESREWTAQKSLQTYAFDGYELTLLNELLIEALKDPELAPIALQMLFHYQDESLAKTDKQPAQEVAFPVIVVTQVLNALLALPSPVALRLQEVSRALPSPGFSFEYKARELFSFELSNVLRSDAIFMAWHKGRAEAVEWVHDELRRRLIAACTVIDGLRARVGDRLFAWPPKFQLPNAWSFQHPEISRLAFIVRYESFIGAMSVREMRTRPWEERVRDGISIPLTCEGGDLWSVDVDLDERVLDDRQGFFDNLLVPAGDDGERAQMSYNDYGNRRAMWSPKTLARVASIRNATVDEVTGRVLKLRLEVKSNKEHAPLRRGDRYVLHPRFTDFTSHHVLARLEALDRAPDADFVRLVKDPVGFASPVKEPGPVLEAATALGDRAGFTSSQRRAFEQLCTRRLTLVWGPPGTGKTHFLAKAILCLAEARRRAGRPLRVGITAFTHAAIENLLAEIEEVAADRGVPPGLEVYKLGRITTPRGEALERLGEEEAARAALVDAILGGTVYSLRKSAEKGLAPFDLLVVDEASQMKFGELALASITLAPGGRLVLAGDDLQLPPIIQGAYPEADDGLPGMQDSIFAYLRARDLEDPLFTCQLVENWRMNATLSRFPAETLYGLPYAPATPEVAVRRLHLGQGPGDDEYSDWLLDPAWPLVVCVLEDVQATTENLVEAGIVARLSCALRERLFRGDSQDLYPETLEGDQGFWRRGLFIVSPHHDQIRAIRERLHALRPWLSNPFVDTVDKMQGQQCEAVIVSYGVSDTETAAREAEFIYSLNRLNVSVTRAKCKTIVFLCRPLLEPSFDLLQNDAAAHGLAHMHRLLNFCRHHGEVRSFDLEDPQVEHARRLTAIRARWTPR